MNTEPNPIKPLNPTAASLLGFLHEGELSGYELAHVADTLIGPFWSLTRSQVYRELAALAARGLVEEGDTGKRSRRPYRLTETGRAAFRTWLEQMPAVESIRYPLLLTLCFGSFVGPELIMGFMAEHQRRHQERLDEYRAVVPVVTDPYQRAVLAFATHYEEAVLSWIQDVPALLAEA